MMWYWVFFGLIVSFLLFLMIYVLDHWQSLNKSQRTSIIFTILTMIFVGVTAWIGIETNEKLMSYQQLELTNQKRHDAILENYEKEPSEKILIRTNLNPEESIKIQGLPEGTQVFVEYELRKIK